MIFLEGGDFLAGRVQAEFPLRLCMGHDISSRVSGAFVREDFHERCLSGEEIFFKGVGQNIFC